MADSTAQFAENLRRLRLAAGLTQQALSDRMQMEPAELSRLERGGRNPRLRTLVRVSRGLDVTLAELLHGME